MRLKAALYYAGVAAAVAAALVVTLRLWDWRPEVPFGYEGDGVFFTVLTKASGEDGLLHLRHLGMPFGVDIADWSAGMPLDYTVLGALSSMLGEAGTAINLWWLGSLVATGVLAAFAFRSLGLEPALALGLGYLFALTPFGFYRNVGHVCLVFHFVPLIALLAVRTAEGQPERLSPGARAAVLLGCAGQGLSYVYYSFFACVLLGAAATLGWLRTRRRETVRMAAAGVLLIMIGTAAGLVPSLVYWHEHGRNPDLQYKRVLESDRFALKIRHLLLPIPDHPLAPWRALAEAADSAGFLDENENSKSRLGTVAGLGFLGLLAYAVLAAAGLARGESTRLAAAAALTLVALLLAVVGGFGSLFALLVSPDIRAYNRIAVFIAFFGLLAAGVGLGRLETAIAGRSRPAVFRGGVLALLLLAALDQASTTGLWLGYSDRARQFDVEREFVRRIESRVARGAMVFQLPHTGMPVEVIRTRMATYDHGRAYLHSRALRWSWGAIVGRNANWQAEVQGLPPVALVRTLVLAGFSGVWIDRLGYDPEAAPLRAGGKAGARPSPEDGIARAAESTPEVSLDGRYVFVGLEAARRQILSHLGPTGFEQARLDALRPPLVPRFLEGFGQEEGTVTEVRRWCGTRGRVVLRNLLNRERQVLITARFLSRPRARSR